MTLPGPRTIRVGVVGASDVARALDGYSPADYEFEVARERTVTVPDDGRTDLVLVATASPFEVVDRVRERRPERPVVVLVDDDYEAALREAVDRGVTDALPRSLLDEAPGTVAERLVGHVERARARTGYGAVYDGVPGTVTLHDPETGEMLHANETLCDLLGYGWETLREMRVGEFTADVAGYDHERAMAVVTSVADGATDPVEVEWPLETADGEVRWVAVSLTAARVGGRELVVACSTDVTERKERERTYEEIFDSVNDAITVHDPDTGEMVDANERMSELTGYDRETLLAVGAKGLTVPTETFDPSKVPEVVERVVEGETVRPYEQAIETADGDRVWLEVNPARATIDGEERFLAIARDVTERRRRERDYREVFENVSDGLVVHEPDTGEMLEVNDRFCELTGYTREELVGETVGLVTSPSHPYERARERIRKARDEGPQLFEWREQTKSGEEHPVEVHLSVVTIGGEERVLASVRKITERKRREREYEQIFNEVNDMIAVHDPEAESMVAVNDTFCEITGYDRERALELGVEGVSADGGFSYEVIRRVAETGAPETVEWLLETADGERRWFEVSVTPATVNGEERVLGISRDVTERRERERRLRESERRLRTITERIDEMVYLTSVDLSEVVYVAGYEEIWGRPVAGLREDPRSFLDHLHPDDADWFRTEVESMVGELTDPETTGKDSYTFEFRIVRPDGETRFVRSDCYPVRPAGDATSEGEATRLAIIGRDVTERKRREGRLASFQTEAADLTAADTLEEATRRAVEVATDTLDLPAVGVYLYAESDGGLRPEVLSPALEATDTAFGPVGPGEGPVWRAFAQGRPVETVGNEECGAGAAVATGRVLPLGNHGAMLVGSPEESLDPGSLDEAHVLAATLEAALNHVRGQRQLADREAELRSTAERAERLDRIARLTRRVEAAITEASTREEVERAVCERLAESGPFELAWVGEVEVGADRLTPRVVAGDGREYAAAVDLASDAATGDVHPAVAAWRTDEVRTVDSVVGDDPSAGWRRRALERGYQSLCSVPLSYDGVTRGVLTVAADRPRAFGDREREVLQQLGTSVGYALTALERRRALESDETVELEFRGSRTSLSLDRLARAAGCRVRHERTVRRKNGRVSVYYALVGDVPDAPGEVVGRTLTGDVSVVNATDGSALVEVTDETWFGSTVAEYGAVLRRAAATPKEVELVVELPTQADVRSFVERLGELRPELELVAQRQHQRPDRTPRELRGRVERRLTDRQYEALATALSSGYFEWPRDATGEDVAERLDITQPTLNKHLRLAERKVFELLFADEDGRDDG